jgi:electron transport complex protein RnfD
MQHKDPKLLLQTAPFLKRGVTTPGLMLDVIIGLLPTIFAAIWFFRISAVLVIAASAAGAMLMEALFLPRGERRRTLLDFSAALTGVLLGLVLPPGVPLWIAFFGGIVAIGLGKVIWGGLGHNLFNPALVGRAFLQAAFPNVMTTWAAPNQHWLTPGNLALPFLQKAKVDVVTTATPLARMKFAKQATALLSLLWGNVAGSLGETSAAAVLLGGIWMIARRTFDWRIPVSILLAAGAFSGILHAASPAKYPAPLFMLLSGGLMFGAVYMATDPVTSPLAPKGAWIFGAGIGVLVILIRIFGGLPEGVMYAILLMNAASPLIERGAQPRPFGREGKTKQGANP